MPLTTLGKNEAAQGATQMWKDGYQVDVAFTSLLKRAQQTLAIVLKITGQEDVPVHQNWRLNERMYGGLTGLNKKETVAKYGVEQVGQWRRSYDTPRTRLAARTRQIDLGRPATNRGSADARHVRASPCAAPPIEKDSDYWPGNDNKYAHIPEADIPLSECLKDTVRRPSLGALAPVGPRL